MAINPLTNSIELLKDFGFFQVILPMILVFAVFFGVLEKTEIFGSGKTNINAIIAFVAAFLVVTVTPIVEAINAVIPSAAFLLILAMLSLMLFAFFGFSPDSMHGSKGMAIIGVVVLIIIFLGVIDVSVSGVNIPVVHQMTQAFVGGEDVGDGGIGAGLSDATDTSGFGVWTDEEVKEGINIGLSLAILVGIPLLVIWFITKGS